MRHNRSLTESAVTLKQTKNYIYLLYLSKRYHKQAFSQEIYDEAIKHIEDYFEVYIFGKRSGAIYSTVIDGKCYLDAYKDPQVRSPIKASILAFSQFILYISKKYDIIYTVNCGDSLLFNFVTKHLGFTCVSVLPNGYKLYEKELHGNRDRDYHRSDRDCSSSRSDSRDASLSTTPASETSQVVSTRRRCESPTDSQRDSGSNGKSRSGRKRRNKKKEIRTDTDDIDYPFRS